MAYVYTKGFGREAPAPLAPLPPPSGGGAWQQTVPQEERGCAAGYVADVFGVCKKIASGDGTKLPAPPPPPPAGGGSWSQSTPAYVPREGVLEEPVQEPAKEKPAKQLPKFFETETKTKTSPVDVPAPPAELPGELPEDVPAWTPSLEPQMSWIPPSAPSSSSLPLIIGVAAVALLLFRS